MRLSPQETVRHLRALRVLRGEPSRIFHDRMNAMTEPRRTGIEAGLVGRVAAGVRYIVSGVTPTDWFGPMQPMAPVAPPDIAGRSFDFPVGANLRIQPRPDETISFADLRGLADGYDLLRLVTEAAKSTEMTNASVPAGIWTFAVRARDVANQLSPLVTTTSLQVVNTYGPVSSLPQAPAWSAGTLSGFVVHYTGVLVPDSTSHAVADIGFAVFDNFVWNPVAQATYTAPAVPFTKLALLRVWAA